MRYSYEIIAREPAQGGGWRLRLLDGAEEVGGGVFPVAPDELVGIAWWNALSAAERAAWLKRATSPTAADAYLAHLRDEAWRDAEATAYDWLDSRE
jgi:hypothetical protein